MSFYYKSARYTIIRQCCLKLSIVGQNNDILPTQQLILFIRSHKLQTIYKTNVANTMSDNICDDEEESAKAH